MIFSKVVPRPLGMLKQVFLGRFEPVVACFGPWKIPKCHENMLFWDQQCVKNGSKTCFSESDPGPFGMLKQVFLGRFEPVSTEFSPLHHMYAPLCALCTYLKAVWWSHLELGEGCRLEDIYYYTPLPFNLANKQQQQATTTTRLRAVSAIAPSQRFGSFAHVAILEPRWWPCQTPFLSQKLTGGGPGRWRQVGRCSPKSAQFWAKNSHFSPKTASTGSKQPNEGKRLLHSTCGLTFS